jgi:hypothetical protein
MDDALKALHESLVRKHLGKRGIHGLNVDEETRTVNIYVDESADTAKAVNRLRKDAGDLKINAIKSRRARLA